jgi:hypothetical protein
MKDSADEAFQYVFTWLEGGDNKGWATHYHPQHPPLSPEVEAALRYLGLARFNDCPEFDFEPCYWQFMAYSSEGDRIWDGNADIAHGSFDSHAQQFSPGIEQLLAAQLAVEPFGMNILPMPTHRPRSQPAARRGATDAHTNATQVEAPSIVGQAPGSYVFDVAFSFAGSERPIAERLNAIVIAAGFRAFYDDAYPEQLWGKELPVVFDEVYRKQARYCVILVSPEYAARMWTNVERRSAQARAVTEKGNEYILPIEVEPAEIPGLPPTVAYLSLKRYTVEQIGAMLVKKLHG